MRRREADGDARFVTFSCFHRLPLLREPGAADCFDAARRRGAFRLYAWVVMPEHVHLLVRPAGGVLAVSLHSLKTSVAKSMLARWRRDGSGDLGPLMAEDAGPCFWQRGGGFDRNVRGPDAFTKHVRYIHRNAVERGLVEAPRVEVVQRAVVGRRTGRRGGMRPAAGPALQLGRVERVRVSKSTT